MRSKTVWLTLMTLLAGGTWALSSAQSLADVAKKERERRARNDERGVESREFSETEIFGEDDYSPEADAEASGDEASEPQAQGAFQVDIDLRAPDDDGNQPDAASRGEDYWRSRMSSARERVAAARRNKEIVDGLHYEPGTTFVDENGTVVIGSLAELRELVARTQAELSSAEQSLRDLSEEARRAGVPPGWLR